MKEQDAIILDTSDEAAQYKTVSGWVSRDGRFYGKDERAARFAGATHSTCECGKLMEIRYTKCEMCIAKADIERYNAYPFEEWDLSKPVYSLAADKYFFNVDDLDEFLGEQEEEEDGLTAADLRLVICEGEGPSPISDDNWCDELPEDGELPDELQKRVDELNKFIATLPPLAYYPSKVRTEYKPIN